MADVKEPIGTEAGSASQEVRQLDLSQLKKFQRTFFCVGPVCLRSGVGFGAGIGCGAGIGAGWAPFVVQTSPGSGGTGSEGGIPQFQVPMQVMQQIPGGYMMLDLLKKVMRNFPGSKTGAGCGVGVGYGVGIGLQYGSGGMGRGGGGFGMASGGGGMGMGMGMSGSAGGGHGMGIGPGMNQQNQQSMQMQQSGGGMQPYAGGQAVPTPVPRQDSVTQGKLERLERRMEKMEDSLALYNRVGELERRMEELTKQGRRR